MSVYRTQYSADASDGRLHSPVFERNMPPLVAALSPKLNTRTGAVLEVGCGTGQHACAFQLAFPALDWWPSDPDPAHRASCAAWRAHLRLPERPALNIDAQSDWAPQVAMIEPLTAVFSANVIHIAPLSVAQGILAGASKVLEPGGLLIFYGPFFIDGDPISDGNARFDQTLRCEDASWGIRDVTQIDALAGDVGLHKLACAPMPANNQLLIYRKT